MTLRREFPDTDAETEERTPCPLKIGRMSRRDAAEHIADALRLTHG
jgi:hypothetical protein